MTPFHEGDHLRDAITHEAGVVTHVYADGWLRVRRETGRTTPAEPRDLAPDPHDHRGSPRGGGGGMTAPTYETDFYRWTQAQAAALRQKDLAALDLDNLAEEIESLGRSDRRAIAHQLERLLLHRLTWVSQPQGRARRGGSWRGSVRQARQAIAEVLEESPSLRDLPAERRARAYARALLQAMDQTGLPLVTFPEVCPWTPEQVLDEAYWPEEQP